MRDATGTYAISDPSFQELSEIDLLSHYQLPDIPDQTDYYKLRVLTIDIDHALFGFGGLLSTDQQIKLVKTAEAISVSCSCGSKTESLCYHEMLALLAVVKQENYRRFFDKNIRKQAFIPFATRYGLDKEEDLDLYFDLQYDKGNFTVHPKHEGILAVDAHAPDQTLVGLLEKQKDKRSEQLDSKKRILVLSRHRFYNQLRFELLDTSFTQAGKPKAPFDFKDPTALIWQTKDIAEAKLYAAVASLQQQYQEDDQENILDALQVIREHCNTLPVFYHDRTISEKVNSKSLQEIALLPLDASVELSVFKRQPFYEIKAYLSWNGERLSLKSLQLQQGYFIQRKDRFFLVQDIATLRLFAYFKKAPEILLVHESKYEDFVKNTLSPLEERIHINYTYVRKALPKEKTVYEKDMERIIYFSQEHSYVNINPVIRYGAIEIALSSKKKIVNKDENGNSYEVERLWDIEDRFKQVVVKQHPDFTEQLQEPHFFYLHHNDFLAEEWFLNAFETWRNEGITLLGFQEMNLTKINPYKAKIDIKIISGTDWFNAKLSLQYGTQLASVKQIHRAVRNKSKYIQLDDGSVGILPNAWLHKITRYFQFGILEADLLRIPKLSLTELDTFFDQEILSNEIKLEVDELRKRLAKVKVEKTTAIPKTLKATLRPYQVDGLQWMNQLDALNLGGCLADDMGLGKTIQVIAFLLIQQEKERKLTNLIIVPTSLLFNWQQELAKFAPSLRVLCLQGSAREKALRELAGYDVVLTSYGLLLSDIQQLKSQHFNAFILDESQAIKNPNSDRYKAARLLHARVRFTLTGTPIENSTYDLYGQLSFACPGLLGSRQFFKDTYAIPIDRFEDSKRGQALQQKIAPFILRRTKQQVAKELPEKTEITIFCEMGEEQREIYNSYEAELRDYLQGKTDDELLKNSMHVLAGLTRLRQICNAPFLLKEGYSPNISAKLDVLIERLQEISTAHKVLVFSQFVGMLDLIKTALDNVGINYAYLTGDSKDRGAIVNRFQDDDTQRVFLISLKAGGVGLNLTAADYIFLVDPWWNPAVENQAIDRSHRIGQDKQVVAVRLICPNTVEEKMMLLQHKKNELARDMIKTDLDITQKFHKKDWLDLLQ